MALTGEVEEAAAASKYGLAIRDVSEAVAVVACPVEDGLDDTIKPGDTDSLATEEALELSD